MNWDSLLHMTVAGNALWQFALLFLVILLAMLLGKTGRYALLRLAARLRPGGRELTATLLTAVAASLVPLAAVAGLHFGLAVLSMEEKLREFADVATAVLFVAGLGFLAYRLIDVVDHWLKSAAGRTQSKMDDMLVPLVTKSLRLTIVVMVVLQVAHMVSDKPVVSLLAGLGVGGLAVAFAAQDTIKNFFGSLLILADKPFELGDRIVVDGFDGPVEGMGLRSTRIRTLEGHLVTIPNGELANKSIQNIGKRPHIRRLMNVTITYDTPPEKVARAVALIKELLADHEGLHPDFPPRVFFNDYNDASLNILVLYWYHPADYWAFMAFGERFNQQLLERFNAEGIDFAFPTQTVYLAGDPKRPLAVPGPVGA